MASFPGAVPSKVRISLTRNSGKTRGKVLGAVLVEACFEDISKSAKNKLKLSANEVKNIRLFVLKKKKSESDYIELLRDNSNSMNILKNDVVVAVSIGEDFIRSDGTISQSSTEVEEQAEEFQEAENPRLALCSKHGYIRLIGSVLDEFMCEPHISDDIQIPETHKMSKMIRDNSLSGHMTFIHRAEFSTVQEGSLNRINLLMDEVIKTNSFPVPLGVGFVQNENGAESYYVACSWPAGQAIRQSLGLGPRHFHVTLGFHPHDVHDVPKDISTIIRPQSPMYLLPHAQHYLTINEESIEKRKPYLEAVSDISHISLKALEKCDDDDHHQKDIHISLKDQVQQLQSRVHELLNISISNPNPTIDFIYLDLDGVLADFDNGVKALTGQSPDDMAPYAMWPRLRNCRWKNGFFGSLDWQKGGKSLWTALMPWGSTGRLSLLTGLPHGGDAWASGQKRNWCGYKLRNECGGNYNEVICCMSREKCEYARSGALLIDDRIKNCIEWGEAGGVYIYHTSFEETFVELVKLGVLPPTANIEDYQIEEENVTVTSTGAAEMMLGKGKGKGGGKGAGKGKGKGRMDKIFSRERRNDHSTQNGKGQKKGRFDTTTTNNVPRYFDMVHTSSSPSSNSDTRRRPCSFFNTPKGCNKGDGCRFVHVKI